MNTVNFFKNKWTGWIIRFFLIVSIADFFYLYGSALIFRINDLVTKTPQPLLILKICFDTAIVLSLIFFVYMRFAKNDKRLRWLLLPMALMFVYSMILGVTTYLNHAFTNFYRLSFTIEDSRLIGVFLLYLLDLACIHFRKGK